MLQNKIVTIIDGDTLVYNLAYRIQDKSVEEVEIEIDNYIKLILNNTNCTYYLGFLGESKTFRHTLYPEYKSNRPDKPEWLTKWEYFIKNRLIVEWKFIKSGILEAEDCAIICANHYNKESNVVLAHIDKDLNFWEGNHYSYVTHQHWYTDNLGKLELVQKKKTKKLYGTGKMWLYAQYLIGDKGDNIPNCRKGCGDVYVYNLLKDCTTEYQLLKKTYSEFLKHSTKEAFILNRYLVTMLDKESFGFKIPSLIPYKKEEIDIFNL